MPRAKKKKALPQTSKTTVQVIEAEIVEEASLDLPSHLSLPDIPAPTGKSLLASFLSDKHEKTAKNYRSALGDFAGWLYWKHRDKEPSPEMELPPGGRTVTDEAVVDALTAFVQLNSPTAHELGLRFRAYLLAIGNAPNTINRKIVALRGCVDRAKILGLCHFDLKVPLLDPENARDTAGCGNEGYLALDEQAKDEIAEAEALVSLCKRDKDPKPLERAKRKLLIATRNQALLTLWYHSGLRRFEALTADYPEDLDIRNVGKAQLRFRGKKRRKKAWHAINKRCVKDLRAWVQLRDVPDGPLFYSTHPSHYGHAMNERTMNKLLEKLAKSAGVEVTPHGLRHTVATHLLEKTGGDVRSVAEFLRHKGLGTVQAYDDNRKQLARRMGDLVDEEN